VNATRARGQIAFLLVGRFVNVARRTPNTVGRTSRTRPNLQTRGRRTAAFPARRRTHAIVRRSRSNEPRRRTVRAFNTLLQNRLKHDVDGPIICRRFVTPSRRPSLKPCIDRSRIVRVVSVVFVRNNVARSDSFFFLLKIVFRKQNRTKVRPSLSVCKSFRRD